MVSTECDEARRHAEDSLGWPRKSSKAKKVNANTTGNVIRGVFGSAQAAPMALAA